MSRPTRERLPHDHGALVAAAAARHLGADPATITVSGDGDRLSVASTGTSWDVFVTDPGAGRPFTLLEFEAELTPVGATAPLPAVAVVDDDRSFLLPEPRGLAGFIEAAGTRTDTSLVADLVVRFGSRRVEHVVSRGDLTEAGMTALREAGVVADPARSWADEAGARRLRFVTAELASPAHRERRGVDFREWIVTVEPAGGGVDWQARPVALGVEGGVDVGALFARLATGLPAPARHEDEAP